ncbi:hypothetical protein JMJ77_0011663, partial [Colletotrichum scovillei]
SISSRNRHLAPRYEVDIRIGRIRRFFIQIVLHQREKATCALQHKLYVSKKTKGCGRSSVRDGVDAPRQGTFTARYTSDNIPY